MQRRKRPRLKLLLAPRGDSGAATDFLPGRFNQMSLRSTLFSRSQHQTCHYTPMSQTISRHVECHERAQPVGSTNQPKPIELDEFVRLIGGRISDRLLDLCFLASRADGPASPGHVHAAVPPVRLARACRVEDQTCRRRRNRRHPVARLVFSWRVPSGAGPCLPALRPDAPCFGPRP